MRHLIDQLEESLNTGQYYLSLFMALSIPDIAGAMESADGLATGPKFKAWYEKWVRPRSGDVLKSQLPDFTHEFLEQIENPLDGEACYFFRCSMLHQGRTSHPKSQFSRVIFIEPGSSTSTVHGSVFDDALCIDLVTFCKEVILGARMWLDAVEGSDPYQKNYAASVQRHAEGLSPYISGVPVIG